MNPYSIIYMVKQWQFYISKFFVFYASHLGSDIPQGGDAWVISVFMQSHYFSPQAHTKITCEEQLKDARERIILSYLLTMLEK